MTRSFALAAATALSFSLAASAAQAAGCAPWVCGENGQDLNGMNMQGINMQGVLYNGEHDQGVSFSGIHVQDAGARDQRQPAAAQPAVKAVILPSGETIRPE